MAKLIRRHSRKDHATDLRAIDKDPATIPPRTTSLDLDEDLPWPNAIKLSTWWSENAGRFDTATRWFAGGPLSAACCTAGLRDATSARGAWQRSVARFSSLALFLVQRCDSSMATTTLARDMKCLSVVRHDSPEVREV